MAVRYISLNIINVRRLSERFLLKNVPSLECSLVVLYKEGMNNVMNIMKNIVIVTSKNCLRTISFHKE
jgi:hypothetical protein